MFNNRFLNNPQLIIPNEYFQLNAEIGENNANLPLAKNLLNTFFASEYDKFMKELAKLERDVLLHDRYLKPHCQFYTRAMRVKAYQQFLAPYKSVKTLIPIFIFIHFRSNWKRWRQVLVFRRNIWSNNCSHSFPLDCSVAELMDAKEWWKWPKLTTKINSTRNYCMMATSSSIESKNCRE